MELMVHCGPSVPWKTPPSGPEDIPSHPILSTIEEEEDNENNSLHHRTLEPKIEALKISIS